MKYTIIKDLVFSKPNEEDPYGTTVLPKGTDVKVMSKRDVSRLPYGEQSALHRMKKRNGNIIVFMWNGRVRTAIKGKDIILAQAKGRKTFLDGFVDGKN